MEHPIFDLKTLTLTYNLDLDFLSLGLHAKIQVCISVRLALRVVTDTHTDTRCQNCYTCHVRDAGCNKYQPVYTFNAQKC